MSTVTFPPTRHAAESCPGFVLAMRAALWSPDGRARQEWMIAARWGQAGAYLSLAWTNVPVTGARAPTWLTPRRAALAVRGPLGFGRDETGYRFTASMPRDMTLAGAFVPARGVVRLGGDGDGTCLWSEGHSAGGAWRIDASRADWIGDFVEPAIDRIDTWPRQGDAGLLSPPP